MSSIKDRSADAAQAANSSFAIHETLGLVRNNLKIQLTGKPAYIPCWAGSPGIGKTTHAKMICEELNLNMFYVSMTKPLEYFSGIPAMNSLTFGDDSNRKNMYVYWSEPELIHCANELARDKTHNGCLIFMDDMHVMTPDVQKVGFELFLERKLGNYKLDNNVAMMGAMNSSNMAGFDGFLSAINNRIQKIMVYLDWEYWYNNCNVDLHPLIAAFTRVQKSMLQEDESTEDSFATYRSWSMLSPLIAELYEEYKKNKDMVWFLNQVYMYARSFMSSQSALALKNNIMQQLTFNFEEQVRSNSYHIDFDDPISQIIFGNVVRYFRDNKDVDNFVKFVCTLVKNYTLADYQNALSNVMYELLGMTNSLIKKNDEESQKAYKLYRYCQEQLFGNKECGPVIHQILGDIMSGKYSDVFDMNNK